MDHTAPDLQLFKKKRNPGDPPELLYMVMHRAENGQCVIDNAQTCTIGKREYPKLSIGLKLAEKMKWTKMGTLQNGQPSYVLGHNLRKDFANNVVPTSTVLIISTANSDEILYKIDADALHQSTYIN